MIGSKHMQPNDCIKNSIRTRFYREYFAREMLVCFGIVYLTALSSGSSIDSGLGGAYQVLKCC